MAQYKTLKQIYDENAGLQKEFPDFNGKGVSGNWTIQDWANKYFETDFGKDGIVLVEEGDSRLNSSGTSDNSSLARFSTDPTSSDSSTNENTVWLYDSEEKTYRPISSTTALMKLVGASSVEEAFKNVAVLSTNELITNPLWEGSFISSKNAIGDDGKIPTETTLIPNSNVYTGVYNYGVSDENRADSDTEKTVSKIIGSVLSSAYESGAISETVWKNNIENATTLQKYVDAVLYGGYNIPDNIYGDLRAKTLLEEGNTAYQNFKAFDTGVVASEWNQTTEGLKLENDANLDPYDATWDIDVSMFENPIFDIPDEAFTELVEVPDITSDEFKTEAESIEASYYDLLMQSAQAQTEQEKALADANYEEYKEALEKKYNIVLSDNAENAWAQIQSLTSSMVDSGLRGSGIEANLRDEYLKDIRTNDELQRENKLDEAETTKRTWLLNVATSDEINEFVNSSAENRQKAKDWGIIPSDEIAAYYSVDNLKELYPSLSDEQIEQMASTIIDENGNYRSNLYQNFYTNKYNISEQKQTYQEATLLNKKLNEEENAYEEYTSVGDDLSGYYQSKGLENTLNETNDSNTSSSTSSSYNSSNIPTLDSGYKFYQYKNADGTVGSTIYDASGNVMKNEDAFTKAGGTAYWKPNFTGTSNVQILDKPSTSSTSSVASTAAKNLSSGTSSSSSSNSNSGSDKVTLYKAGGKTKQVSANGAQYYVKNYGWSTSKL